MSRLLTTTLGTAEVVTSLAGVPFVAGAAMILKEIQDTCDEIRIYKRKVGEIRMKCFEFSIIIDAQSAEGMDPALQTTLDEARGVLEHVSTKMARWKGLSAWSMVLKMSEISDGLDKCQSEIETSLKKVEVAALCIGNRVQKQTLDATTAALAELMELKEKGGLLRQAFQSEDAEIMAMQRAGTGNVVERLMEAGQKQIRDEMLIYDAQRSASPTPIDAAHREVGSETSDLGTSTLAAVPRSTSIQDALYHFHLKTGVLPAVKILDGEVTKTSQRPVAGGQYSDIWLGLWLGHKKVALKGLRSIKADDPKATRRIEREIKTWSALQNDHILPFYGIVTNIGAHIHMVSPWQENNNVLEYLKNNPKEDRLRLIKGAAYGLAYLHHKNIVHGNVKCTNILVSEKGEACIADFGMSKLMVEVGGPEAAAQTATRSDSDGVRWMAPELILEEQQISTSAATDVFSFGRTVLELVTGKHPFADRKHFNQVFYQVAKGLYPARPTDGEAAVSDELWALLERCWEKVPETRPSMDEVVADLEGTKR